MNEPILTHKGVVYPWQCDHNGHMNVMFYVGKFNEAASSLLLEGGITPSYLRDNSRATAAVQQNITYKRELRAGDVLTVRSHILEVRDKVFRFQQEMMNAETSEVAALIEVTAVHIDSSTRKACAFPPAIRERLQKLILHPPTSHQS
jgi:acyl-CoA thioester hydrolase